MTRRNLLCFTWHVQTNRVLDKLAFSISLINKGEVKLKTLCMCVSEHADSWPHEASPTALFSLAELSSSAFNKKTSCRSAYQDRDRISPTHHSASSVVTSHGPLNGRPQIEFKWLDETEKSQTVDLIQALEKFMTMTPCGTFDCIYFVTNIF